MPYSSGRTTAELPRLTKCFYMGHVCSLGTLLLFVLDTASLSCLSNRASGGSIRCFVANLVAGSRDPCHELCELVSMFTNHYVLADRQPVSRRNTESTIDHLHLKPLVFEPDQQRQG